ncbi:MAG: fibronectin type III domain-containing protein, partial [Deinococcales bacterium]
RGQIFSLKAQLYYAGLLGFEGDVGFALYQNGVQIRRFDTEAKHLDLVAHQVQELHWFSSFDLPTGPYDLVLLRRFSNPDSSAQLSGYSQVNYPSGCASSLAVNLVDTTNPSTVTGLSSKQFLADRALRLAWNNPDGFGETSYRLYGAWQSQRFSDATLLAEGLKVSAARLVAIADARAGQNFCFWLSRQGARAESAPSQANCINYQLPPSQDNQLTPPQGLRLREASGYRFLLTWQAVNEATIGAYNLSYTIEGQQGAGVAEFSTTLSDSLTKTDVAMGIYVPEAYRNQEICFWLRSFNQEKRALGPYSAGLCGKIAALSLASLQGTSIFNFSDDAKLLEATIALLP